MVPILFDRDCGFAELKSKTTDVCLFMFVWQGKLRKKEKEVMMTECRHCQALHIDDAGSILEVRRKVVPERMNNLPTAGPD